MCAIEMTNGPVGASGEYRDGGVLIALSVFTAQVVLESTALAGAEQAQVMPASFACMRTKNRRVRGSHDSEIYILRDVVRYAIVTIDPKCAHWTGAGLSLTVHEVIDHERAIRSRK